MAFLDTRTSEAMQKKIYFFFEKSSSSFNLLAKTLAEKSKAVALEEREFDFLEVWTSIERSLAFSNDQEGDARNKFQDSLTSCPCELESFPMEFQLQKRTSTMYLRKISLNIGI